MPIQISENNHPRRQAVIARLLVSLMLVIITASCKSPDQYKVEADDEVYQIIEQKWDDNLGDKGRYRITDDDSESNTDSDDKIVARTVPASGVITLQNALEMTVAHNRTLQSERENLYLKALELTLVRHAYQPNYFGPATAGYSLLEEGETLAAQGGLGLQQYLSTGATIGASVAAGWVNVLSGDLKSGLTSVFTGATSCRIFSTSMISTNSLSTSVTAVR